MWRFAYCLLLGTALLTARSAEVSLGDLSLAARYWSTDDGLWGPRVDAVIQTSDGHLWAGNFHGLFRFNGRRFERVMPSGPGPEVRLIQRICEDASGGLWLQTFTSRLIRYRDGQFDEIPIPPGTGAITAIRAKPGGGLIAVCIIGQESALFRISGSSAIPLSERVGEKLRDLAVTDDGEVWVVQENGLVAKLEGQRLMTVAAKEIRRVGCLGFSADRKLVAVAPDAVFELSSGKWRALSSFPRDSWLTSRPAACASDQDGRLWFASTGDGLCLLEPGDVPKRVRQGQGTLPGTINSLFADRDGDIWAASFTGLHQFRYSPFVTWPLPAELATSQVLSVEADAAGTVWMSCYGAICSLAPGDTQPRARLPRPQAEITIFTPDNCGGLWLGSKLRPFIHWDGNWETPSSVEKTDVSPSPNSMVMDHEGLVWLCTLSGIYRCDPRNPGPLRFLPASGKDGLPKGAYRWITQDTEGNVLAVFRAGGLYRRAAGLAEWRPMPDTGKAEARGVGRMTPDREGRLWGDFGSGMICWAVDGTPRSVGSDQLGLAVEAVSDLVADDDGGLWLTTATSGVAYANRDQLFRWMEKPDTPFPFQWFSRADGLGSLGGSFTAASICKGSDGRVWVATAAGLSAISPKEWLARKERTPVPAVAIEGGLADGKPQTIADGILRVAPGISRLGIRFASLSVGFPGEIRFRHRLLGLDEQWVESGAEQTAFYQKLKPGRYSFEVSAANRYGVWNPRPTRLPVVVLPRWWQRTETRFAGALLFGLAIAFGARSRWRRLQEREALHADFSRRLIASQEEERRRIAAELHDSLGQNLTVVKNRLTFEQMEHPERHEGLAAISRLVTEAIQDTRRISHNLRPYVLDRVGFTRAIEEILRQTREATGLQIHQQLENVDRSLSPENEIGLFRIIQESLNNAVKHADASQVSISLTRDRNRLHLRIDDDGRGFDVAAQTNPKTKTGGLGLNSIEERVRIMGGTIRWISARRQGTKILISVPLPASNG